jgi:hypothetical protein
MLEYDICYLNDDGSLACSMTALCRDDLHAKILAHAMKLAACRRFEVWQGRRVVYERPQLFGELSLEAGADMMVASAPRSSSPAQHPLA